MCGIVGFFGAFQASALKSGLRALAHRGPDDSGIYLNHSSELGLAHARLSILDLSETGHQPMESEDRNNVIVFNGEIYNFRELRRELEAKGHWFRGHSDTEVLLHLYRAKGEDMLRCLNGIFAFALWDARAATLFLARDNFGVKPLYFAESARGIAFASEIKGLLALVPEARELDPAALHRYLSFLWCPGSRTALRAVRKLEPGEAMTIQNGRVQRRWAWYRLPAIRGARPNISETEAVSGTVSGLRTAVHRQMVSDVPVGAFLSGGLDSSSVVAFAREAAPNIQCFTIDSEGGQEAGTTDDLPYARRVASHLGVALEVIRIDAHRMASDLESMVVQLEEPLADPAPLNVLYISRLARENGVKVLLSGVGGDDLFSGYRRHAALHFDPIWRWLPSGIRVGLERWTRGLSQRNPLTRRTTKFFRGAGLDGDERLAALFAWASEGDLMALYSKDFRAAATHSEAMEPMREFLARIPTEVAPLERLLALEQRFFLTDHNLLYTDKMSMAAGVEVRVPFLDVDLVEHAAQIPSELKQKGRIGKWVLKKSMEPYLPHDVIYRPKTGFGAPLRRWMRHELRPLMNDLLSSESLNRRGLFDPTAVHRLMADNESGRVDAAYTLLSLLNIEIWCRSFLDSAPAGQVQPPLYAVR
jgi:asparagine synthase (glutamine-hydrolysing)